jgi:hypothetical protein
MKNMHLTNERRKGITNIGGDERRNKSKVRLKKKNESNKSNKLNG